MLMALTPPRSTQAAAHHEAAQAASARFNAALTANEEAQQTSIHLAMLGHSVDLRCVQGVGERARIVSLPLSECLDFAFSHDDVNRALLDLLRDGEGPRVRALRMAIAAAFVADTAEDITNLELGLA